MCANSDKKLGLQTPLGLPHRYRVNDRILIFMVGSVRSVRHESTTKTPSSRNHCYLYKVVDMDSIKTTRSGDKPKPLPIFPFDLLGKSSVDANSLPCVDNLIRGAQGNEH